MPDEADCAQEYSEFFLKIALGKAKKPLYAEASTKGEKRCIDCGEAISAERIAAVPGCRRCMTCQQEFEREEALCRMQRS